MKTIHIILIVAGILCAAQFAPQEGPLAASQAQAAVTATIAGTDNGGAFTWRIDYDDATRDVTTSASGTGFCLVTIEITASITRTVAYYPSQGAQSINQDLATRMAAADFQVISDGQTQVLVSGIPPAQVRRIVGKAGGLGGFVSQSEWSRA